MKPENIPTKIFLDSGNPEETQKTLDLLGFLDGQTTNPSLIAKHPDTKTRVEQGVKFTEAEIYSFYKTVVRDIATLIPKGSISVEVYADATTTSNEMLEQGETMYAWIPNAHIKFPTTVEGLEAAHKAILAGMRVNMTLVFSLEQAAAVHAATTGADKGDVFVSPFIGRLDDQGQNGMDLISNILQMYNEHDSHVEVLTASVRSYDHFLAALQLQTDIITCPFGVLEQWAHNDLYVPGDDWHYDTKQLEHISYEVLDLSQPWRSFDSKHPLTEKGMQQFSNDWNNLIY